MASPLTFWIAVVVAVVGFVVSHTSRSIDESEISRRMETHRITVESINALWFHIPAFKSWSKFMSSQFSAPARVYRVVGVDQDGKRREMDVLINPDLTFEPQILKSRNIE